VVETGPARADQLAETAAIPLSTAYRYLRTLRRHGFVTEASGLVAPGPLLAPASGRIGRGELVTIASPALKHLAELTGETAVLAVRAGLHAVCVHQVESDHAVRLAFRIGEPLPLYAGAGQRTLLAHAPPEVIQAVLAGELEQFTPNTPTAANLARRLDSARLTGVATSRGEYSRGGVAIAAPVFCNGVIVCSLTAAGPDTRCGPRWQARTKPILQELSERLGADLEVAVA
jgi:DNA-binding IclR family transcriptional regulator